MFAYSEDQLGKAVLERILSTIDVDYTRWTIDEKRGNGRLQASIPQYAKLANRHDVILFTDLDAAACPPALIRNWMGRTPRPTRLHIRVAVREVESWLLADREGVADFLRVPVSVVPRNPDQEADPKRTLLRVAARSKARAIREDIVVFRNNEPRQALNYNSSLATFVADRWDIDRAVAASPSLARTVARLASSLRGQP